MRVLRSRFQHGEIGNFIPPSELAEYDADYLGPFHPHQSIGPITAPARWVVLQRDYRRRALRQLYAEHLISARSYLFRLHRLRAIISEGMKSRCSNSN